MSFFTQQTSIAQIDDENSVTVRKLTFGEFSKVLSDNAGAEAQGLGVVRAAIVSWDGPGFDDREPTPENIDALPVEVVMKIIPVATELNSVDTDVEGKA